MLFYLKLRLEGRADYFSKVSSGNKNQMILTCKKLWIFFLIGQRIKYYIIQWEKHFHTLLSTIEPKTK